MGKKLFTSYINQGQVPLISFIFKRQLGHEDEAGMTSFGDLEEGRHNFLAVDWEYTPKPLQDQKRGVSFVGLFCFFALLTRPYFYGTS